MNDPAALNSAASNLEGTLIELLGRYNQNRPRVAARHARSAIALTDALEPSVAALKTAVDSLRCEATLELQFWNPVEKVSPRPRCADCGAELDVWSSCPMVSPHEAALRSARGKPMYCGVPSIEMCKAEAA